MFSEKEPVIPVYIPILLLPKDTTLWFSIFPSVSGIIPSYKMINKTLREEYGMQQEIKKKKTKWPSLPGFSNHWSYFCSLKISRCGWPFKCIKIIPPFYIVYMCVHTYNFIYKFLFCYTWHCGNKIYKIMHIAT